ncbi:hypothetical protein [Psychromonas sp. CNPT3]|uniref:hypothetical protein n=1 Tax=Psychromonas sp. CNPT3 TaxID=314282 RepID=UPI00006E895A|nr:hypothetical protein [Psychromonas sp. CNPT3]
MDKELLYPVLQKKTERKMLELESIVKTQGNLISELQTKLKNTSSQPVNDNTPPSISFVEYTSIALACVTLLITALGIGVAILSVWGYNNIKSSTNKIASDLATSKATTVAKEQVKKDIPIVVKEQLNQLINEGELNKTLEDVVDMIMRNNKHSESSIDPQLFAELDEEQEELNESQ